MNRPHCLQIDACAAKAAGHCRTCWGKYLSRATRSDPALEARRRSSVARTAAETLAPIWRSAEGRAKLAERARRHAVLLRPESMAKARSPAAIAKRSASRSETMLGWCPVEYRALNAELLAKRIPLTERKRIVAEEIERAPIRARRQIAEFDRRQRDRAAREKLQAY